MPIRMLAVLMFVSGVVASALIERAVLKYQDKPLVTFSAEEHKIDEHLRGLKLRCRPAIIFCEQPAEEVETGTRYRWKITQPAEIKAKDFCVFCNENGTTMQQIMQ